MRVVERLPPGYGLRGSFANDDFHYDAQGDQTLSDLDLLYPCGEAERHGNARAVQSRLLESGVRVRVSVQPANHHAALTLADSRYVTIGEYLRHCHAVRADAVASSYLRAKTALGIVRRVPNERYRDTAAAISTAASRLALEVKVGNCREFSTHDAVGLIHDAQLLHAPEISLMLDLLASHPPRAHMYSGYIRGLESRPAMSSWLRALMARLVADARSRACGSSAPAANGKVSGQP